jgi:hypothetical protein
MKLLLDGVTAWYPLNQNVSKLIDNYNQGGDAGLGGKRGSPKLEGLKNSTNKSKTTCTGEH